MNNALEELERFQTDRGLHKKPFDIKICHMNIIEEMLEMHGVGDNEKRELSEGLYMLMKGVVDGIKKHPELAKEDGITYEEPTEHDLVDGLGDIQVFAGGDINKLGYSNIKCLLEVGKEINSRTGEIVNGKFQKYKTAEAMALWYEADFSNCKLQS